MQYREMYFEVCVLFNQPSGLKFQLVLWASSSYFLLIYILLEDMTCMDQQESHLSRTTRQDLFSALNHVIIIILGPSQYICND